MQDIAYNEIDQLEDSHWWYKGMRDISQRLLHPIINGRSDLCILDAGCGAGGNITALSPYGTVFGIDYSPLALQYAQKRHPDRLMRADITHLPYADASFDLVTSFDVLYMVQDDESGFRELSRVTREGGYVLVRLAAMQSLYGAHDVVVKTLRRYSAEEVRTKMQSAGLEIVKLSYANSLLLPLVYITRKIQNWQIQKGAQAESDVNATAEPLNSLLAGILKLEGRWIANGLSFPAGVSLFALAQKPIESHSQEQS